MKTVLTGNEENDTGLWLWIEDGQEKILIDSGLKPYEAKKYKAKIDRMISRFREKVVEDIECIATEHYDPDDWDFRNKIKAYKEKKELAEQ
jgi:hypothetical protein